MAAELLTVNEFSFCAEHGEEYCARCTYDFRSINNYVILDELDQQFVELLSDDRTFTFNIYHLGVRKTGNKKSPCYKCEKHDTEDCSICYNWVEFITKELQQELKDEKWLKKRQKYLERCD